MMLQPRNKRIKQGRADLIEKVTVDALQSSRGLPQTIDVCTIDTEGHDPLVLEGMHDMLRNQRVTLLEFEYGGKGFWQAGKPSSRTLESTVATLGEVGYRCYLEAAGSLHAPINHGCWRPAFETHKWSNVLCTHHPRARGVIDANAWASFRARDHGASITATRTERGHS